MKKRLPLIIITLMMLAGSGLLLFPDVSSWYNDMLQSSVIRAYDRHVRDLCEEEIASHLYRAAQHNDQLGAMCPTWPFIIGYRASLPEDYSCTLNVQGVMAWIDIPAVDISLPIIHGSCQDVLDKGVGHIEGTAFPIGGINTHSALTAHTGRPTARMFTDLRDVEIGDVFFISVMGKRLAYQVDDIRIIWPHEIEWLRIVPGQDLVTLITCYPYTINTHRLLVRGTRIPYEYDEAAAPAFSMANISPRVYVVAAFFLFYLYMMKMLKPEKDVVTAVAEETHDVCHCEDEGDPGAIQE